MRACLTDLTCSFCRRSYFFASAQLPIFEMNECQRKVTCSLAYISFRRKLTSLGSHISKTLLRTLGTGLRIPVKLEIFWKIRPDKSWSCCALEWYAVEYLTIHLKFVGKHARNCIHRVDGLNFKTNELFNEPTETRTTERQARNAGVESRYMLGGLFWRSYTEGRLWHGLRAKK